MRTPSQSGNSGLTGPILVNESAVPFEKSGRHPSGRLGRLIDEYGHGSGRSLPLHRNPGLEIVYLPKGKLVWQCEGKRETIHPDSIYFTMPWEVHGSAAEFEPGHEWYFAVIRAAHTGHHRLIFPPELSLSPTQSNLITTTLLSRKQRAWPATPIVRTIMPALCAELDNPGPLSGTRVVNMCTLLLSEIAAIVAGRVETGKDDNFRVNKLIAELHRRLAEEWTLGRMAGVIGLKRTQFTSLLRKQTGDTPTQFLNRIRTARARELLASTNRGITEIALECGFSSSQYFSDVFRRFTGSTATQYRIRNRTFANRPTLTLK